MSTGSASESASGSNLSVVPPSAVVASGNGPNPAAAASIALGNAAIQQGSNGTNAAMLEAFKKAIAKPGAAVVVVDQKPDGDGFNAAVIKKSTAPVVSSKSEAAAPPASLGGRRRKRRGCTRRKKHNGGKRKQSQRRKQSRRRQ